MKKMAKHAKRNGALEAASEITGLCAVVAGLYAVGAVMVAVAPVVGGEPYARCIEVPAQEPLPPIVDKEALPDPKPEPEWTYEEPTYEAHAYDYWSDPQIWGNGPADYHGPSSGLTQSGGVNYHDGRRETWYSSNTLCHYRTNEWTADAEGFYRDANGYYVVAASDMPQGTTFEGSKGTCIVLDSGCAAGTTDYYVNWD